ncbi:MAG TPA: AzlC family ABC transporter permease [Hyphomicrobiaceae bacterium]|nr:AzlC family ABC transporter permease [Hyphomicrobiaceae bacterium]
MARGSVLRYGETTMPKSNDCQQPGDRMPGETPVTPPTTHLGAFARGLCIVLSVPAALLFSAGIGFGALARDGGFSAAHTAFITGSMLALPNQVVLVDQLMRDETLLAAVFAVALAGLRLLPMTVTIAPLLKGRRPRPLLETLAVHFIAVSPWIESQRRLPALPPDLRLACHLGLGLGFWIVMMTGSLTGYALAGSVPATIAATLLFLTPIYFVLSLLATSRSRMDVLAVAIGCALAPVLYMAAPGFDLLATGLLGGTLAFLLRGRRA